MLYEVVLQSTYFNQECINRFNYVSTGEPATVQGSFALAFALGCVAGVDDQYPADTPFAAMRAIQGTAYAYNQIIVKAIYDNIDFYANPFISGTAGVSTGGDNMSPVNTYGLRTTRVRQDIGRGYKRFSGVVEAGTVAGGVIASDTLTALNALGEKLAEVIVYDDEGNTISFAPCVVGKEKYETPSGRFAYRYYASQATQNLHLATGIGWEAYTQQRTQRSRQYGKGS